MDAYISGCAGRAVMVEGMTASFLDAMDLNTAVPASRSSLHMLLADAGDLSILRNTTRADVRARLEREYKRELGLRILDLVLSEDDPLELSDLLTSLEEVLGEKDRCDFIYRYLFSVDLLREENALVFQSKIYRRFPIVASTFNFFLESRADIRVVREAWNKEAALFLGLEQRDRAEFRAVTGGVFKSFVMARIDPAKAADALLNAHLHMAPIANARTFVSEWARSAGLNRREANKLELNLASEVPEEDGTYYRPVGRADFAGNVQGQIAVIQKKVTQGNLDAARSFTRELVAGQINRQEAQYAAKTLCNLAQTAKQHGHRSLQVEWVEAATKAAPQDPWAWGQAGDAYLSLFRFSDAEYAFIKAIEKGDRQYGNIGLGRIYYNTGRFVQAEKSFLLATTELGDAAVSARAWIGLGESIADQLAWERARVVFEQARMKFPYDTQVIAAFAGMLRSSGDYEEAEAMFRDGINQSSSSVSCNIGLAELLKSAGPFAEALALYDKLHALVPEDIFILCGRADVYHDGGNLEKALDEYRRATIAFPHEPSGFSGLAETLKDMGRHVDAQEVYAGASARFYYDPYIRNGRANLLSVRGDYKAALAAYDENICDFPQNFVSHAGRAQMLKHMRLFDEALSALHQVEMLKPNFMKAKYHRAQIYVLTGRFDDALQLVNVDRPRTYSEWLAFHVKGMAMLKKGQTQDAEKIFRFGTLHLPFAALKQSYQNALAYSYIVARKFRDAELAVLGAQDPVGKIIAFHAYAEQGKPKIARKWRDVEHLGDSAVVGLLNILASKYGVRQRAVPTSEKIIGDRVAELILSRAA